MPSSLAAADLGRYTGDRRGALVDPFGHIWLLATRQEEISIDELQRRFKAMFDRENVSEELL
jgi:PhnB protein